MFAGVLGHVQAGFDWLERRATNSRRSRWIWGLGISLVIILWFWPYWINPGSVSFHPGDTDQFFQTYEAVRKSILTYHQFPWWNPWVGGGTPLFANPQMGVFSPQTLFVLAFGSVFGLKLSVIFYGLLGFWGAFVLFRKHLRTTVVLAAALSFCWVFDGFYIIHLPNHFTFCFFLVFPWLLYLQLNLWKRRYWLYYGLALAAMALAAVHYALFQAALVLSLVGLAQLVYEVRTGWTRVRNLVLRFAGALAVMLVLAGPRLFYSAQYVLEFPRKVIEPANRLSTILVGMFLPAQNARLSGGRLLTGLTYSPGEYVADIGVFVGLATVLLLGYFLAKEWRSWRQKRTLLLDREVAGAGLLLLAALGFMVLALGRFAKWAPYTLLQHLPVYGSMQVSSRWLIWAGLALLVLIAYGAVSIPKPRWRTGLSMLAVMGALELSLLGLGAASHEFGRQPVVIRGAAAPFIEYDDFDPMNLPADLRQHVPLRPGFDRNTESYMYEATLNNIGEIRGYEPLDDTRFFTQGRCGINDGCDLVMSHNAIISSWTPNVIELRRTAPGPIVLDLAPSKFWTANGVRLDPNQKDIGVGLLTVSTPSRSIRLAIDPPSIWSLIKQHLARGKHA